MMCGLIDLNTVNEDDEEMTPSSFDSPTSSSSCASAPANLSAATPAVCMELWHACAGPLISLPKKGNAVVYLPQGHLEYVADFPAAGGAVDLAPHVFCRVVDVKLQVTCVT